MKPFLAFGTLDRDFLGKGTAGEENLLVFVIIKISLMGEKISKSVLPITSSSLRLK
jgi:hypothetical protein